MDTGSQKRLEEIERELAELKAKKAELSERWRLEKSVIQQIRKYKAEIEQAKIVADNFEREGNLEKVAEIRYGQLHKLNKALADANDKLNNIQQSGKMLREEVSAEDIAEIVAKWTGIPVKRMLESERAKLLNIESRIHQRLINQEDAVTAVANAIRRSRAGLQDPNRPIGSFIFIGTTGVGKTEMARALAEFLFDDENALVRIDMSEYTEKFSVSRLIGAPPGYVGYEEGGQITEAIRRKPYSVVLLDEIEKAHPEVFNVLLQLLDDGRLTDGKGRTVNFKNTIVIMTSNLGTELLAERFVSIDEDNRDSLMSSVKMELFQLLRKRLRPEFLNRIDEIILFKPLARKEIHKIAELQLRKLREKLNALSIELTVTPAAIDWLAELGYDSHYGARPLKRAVQKHISDSLALKLLAGDFISGDRIIIDSDNTGKFVFNKG